MRAANDERLHTSDPGARPAIDPAGRKHAVAILGMSGRFPRADGVEALWRNLVDGADGATRLSDEELLAQGIPLEVVRDPRYVKVGAVLDGIELFDAAFFGMSAGEARAVDPQQRLFLECAWEALEAAGYSPAQFAGAIGVFGSTATSSYLLHQLAGHRGPGELGAYGMSFATVQLMFGNDKDYLATRVAYKLDLRGPALTVQSACSSSLLAVHLACQSLLSGECDMALAGGVSIKVPQRVGYFHEDGSIMSPDGRCRPFDASAAGTLFGSGVGVVVLKRLEEALADGDAIRAVIRGSAANNDGARKAAYSAPSVDAQAAVVSEALAVAGVPAASIGYLEAHGTGTALGDPVEVAALTQAFRRETQDREFCALGSAKSAIGHLEVASGIASLIKAGLAVERGVRPGLLHFERPNPQLELEASPFTLSPRSAPWRPEGGAPRRAGVSSLGVGGTNVHVVLEEPPAPAERHADAPRRPLQLLPLSARTPTALARQAQGLADHLERHAALDLSDVAFTLGAGRNAFDHRRAVLAASCEDAVAQLRGAGGLLGQDPGLERRVAFLFSGQGAQHVDAARELHALEPVFRDHVDRCCALLAPSLGLDLRELLFPPAGSAAAAGVRLAETRFTQPALFVLEYALARLWASFGVRPRELMGHSIGEYVAACLAGVFSLEDALRLVALRGELMQGLPPGAMLSVPLSAGAVQPLLGAHLSIAALNEPARTVVSGPPEEVERLERELGGEAGTCRRLRTSHAFHSAMMDPILRPFADAVAKIRLRPPRLPVISNVTGDYLTGAQATDPAYWAEHLRRPVRFEEGVRRLLEAPGRVLVEVGPGQTLSTLARRHPARGEAQVVVSSTRHPDRPGSDVAHLQDALARLWISGVSVDWTGFHAGRGCRRVALPTYPFERQRHWVDAPARSASTVAPAAGPAANEPAPAAPVPDASARSAAAGAPGPGKARPALAVPYVAPRNELESKLAQAWGEVLGIDAVGVEDSFFDLGGDSIIGIQLAARAARAGLRLTPKQLFERQTIAALAEVVAAGAAQEDPAADAAGPVPLTPAQRWFLERGASDPARWAVPVRLLPQRPISLAVVERALEAVSGHHPALRLRFRREAGAWGARIAPPAPIPGRLLDLSGQTPEAQARAVETARAELAAALDLDQGPLLGVALVDRGPGAPQELLLAVHHLLADNATQRILLEDLCQACAQLSAGGEVQLQPRTTSYRRWAEAVRALAGTPRISGQEELWTSPARRRALPLPFAAPPAGTAPGREGHTVSLGAPETQRLIRLQQEHRCRLEEVLLAALLEAARPLGADGLLLLLEGQGRELALPGLDVTRTAGWLTTVYPGLLVPAPDGHGTLATLRAVKEQLRAVPDEGMGHGLLADAAASPASAARLAAQPAPQLAFAWLGGLDVPADPSWPLAVVADAPAPELRGAWGHALEILAWIQGGALSLDFTFRREAVDAGVVRRLADGTRDVLQRLLGETAAPGPLALSPTDFPEAGVSQQELDEVMAELAGAGD